MLIRDGAGLTDAQLLELFISQKDEAAFEALVRRYGSMVLKVCHRVIRNHHDAEDAYQATFLLLARKAQTVKQRERVANLLHGVAFRTALNARKLRTIKWGREKQVSELPEPQAAQQHSTDELHAVLDQELNRLADIYRLPILLCDLEGKSIKLVAQDLGWPQGTVAGRLARGRKLLAKQLARHGLAMASGAVFLQSSASASISPALVASTVKAASAIVSGKSAATGLISANVAVLMKGALSAMSFTKLKIGAAVLVVGSIFSLGGGVLLNGTAGGQRVEVVKDNAKAGSGRATAKSKENVNGGKSDVVTGKTDHDKLPGTWRVVSSKNGGKETFQRDCLRWWIGKDKIIMLLQAPDADGTIREIRQEATYHLWGDSDDRAPASSNINLIMQFSNGAAHAPSQVTERGIFALEGDRLVLCCRQRGYGDRPREIPATSSKDDPLWIMVLERETAPPKTDEERLQGDWKLVSGEDDGEQLDEDTVRLSFLGDLVSFFYDEEHEVVFKLENTKNPKRITLIYKIENGDRRRVGIYSLHGDDLKICYPDNDKAACPDDFTAAKGSRRRMFVLKRVKGDRQVIQGQGSIRKKDSAATNSDAGNPDAAKTYISTTNSSRIDMEKFQGTWKVVQTTSNGKQFDSQKGNSWKIDGQKIEMTPGFGIGNKPPGPTEATFQLGGDKFDTKRAPNGFNLTHPGMRAMRGIYACSQEARWGRVKADLCLLA